ncbi:uncharacterized protein LOC8268598 [Ricinus communis]|uniref:Phosphatidylinositol n-acetylglucosaminyltransferase subunit p, putative n=1 Tax=Ricinus communis TaxID=3988 RepID=B9SYA4_RICCO|nr:uncharacterized protein LOC8268598 [Ricinus communis]EEF31408.1 phosphatidylinositol n-acetylglucosaminyltransferase subunit p, putative [Ricinus communis]|eukprot:XP_002530973.1 uncharacterized protein LOC8268598 [Ricinus communis]
MLTKQPVPSVLARLMGLDEMPPEQPVQKKPRVLSENYLRRVASIGVRDKYPERYSFRLTTEEQDECKNGLQVLETLWRNKRHVSGHKKLNEMNDVCLQSGHVAVFKSPCASDCRNISMSRKFRTKSEQGYVNSSMNVQNGHGICSSREVSIGDINNFCGSNLKLSSRSCITTGIVVLKSNRGKADTPESYFSLSPQSHDTSDSGNGKKSEYLTSHSWNMHVEMKERKNIANDIRPVRRRSRFLRERIKDVGQGITCTSLTEPSSEISFSNSFVKEPRSTIPSSPILSDRKSQVYCSDKLYGAREAKKQISERWKTTKRFQQVDVAKTLGEILSLPDKSGKYSPSCRGVSEIGDVNFGTHLDISRWFGKKHEDVRDLQRSRCLLACFNAVGSAITRTSHEPLENDGYMGGLKSINLLQNKPREEELNQIDSAEYRRTDFSNRNSQVIPYLESEKNFPVEDIYVVQNEQENNFKEKDSGRQISVVCRSSERNNQTLLDTWMMQEGHKNEFMEEDFPEQIPIVPESSMRSSFPISTEVDAANKAVKISPFICKEHELESRNSILLAEKEHSSYIQDTPVQQEIFNEMFEEESISSQYSGTDPESLMSAEEAYQPSPNSVLEPIYMKEISPVSNCFEGVNTSLHGLQMQLELLKSEGLESYSEASSMMVSSDEDTVGGSVIDYEEKEYLMRSFGIEESRAFSYLVDVLAEAGFHNASLHADFDVWHSQECPISYSVFETLEKKYGEQISWKRSERKLLFDRINSGLVDILQPSMGVLTSSKPVARRFNFSLGHEMIEEELWMLLVNQEKEVSKESEKFFGKGDGWLELDEDIQVIGREIENSLIDELVAELA